MLSRSYCLHQARVCLSLARLTDDANARRRLEEMALSFAERIGGSEDLEHCPDLCCGKASNRQADSSES
jgi:hypothetical protein